MIIIIIVDEVLGNRRGNRRCDGNAFTLQIACSIFHVKYGVWGWGKRTHPNSDAPHPHV